MELKMCLIDRQGHLNCHFSIQRPRTIWFSSTAEAVVAAVESSRDMELRQNLGGRRSNSNRVRRSANYGGLWN